MLIYRNWKAASHMFSQRLASIPLWWTARLNKLGENATDVSFSSWWACAALPMSSADNGLAFAIVPISGKLVLFGAIPVHCSVSHAVTQIRL